MPPHTTELCGGIHLQFSVIHGEQPQSEAPGVVVVSCLYVDVCVDNLPFKHWFQGVDRLAFLKPNFRNLFFLNCFAFTKFIWLFRGLLYAKIICRKITYHPVSKSFSF